MNIKIWFVILLMAAPFIGHSQTKKLNILTTTGIIADTTANIGGKYVEVNAMMGSGVDPHLYQARLGDVSRISKADIILYNGLHLEAGLQKIFEKLPQKAVAVSKDIYESELIVRQNAHDPHIWMNVRLWMTVSKTIARVLSEKDPRHTEYYSQNLKTYLNKLSRLDTFVRKKMSLVPLRKRVLITAHDAFSYFGKEYNVEVKALMGISTLTEAGTGDVRALADEIADRKIKALFVENSIPVKYIEAVQKSVQEKGFQVNIGGELYSDSMGEKGTPDGNYFGMLRHNTLTIANALK